MRALLAAAAALALALPGPAPAQDPCADYVPQARPQNASRDVVGQELDAIVEQGFMTFAVYEDNPPYSWEEGGTPRGVDVEVARIVAAELGVEPRFRFVGSGENLDADLRDNIWIGPVIGGRVSNVMMRVPYDSRLACRAEQVVFTGVYARESIAIAYDEAAYPDDPPVPAYFRFDTVAVENDSIADFYLSSLPGGGTADQVRRYPDMTAAMAALAAGETKAAMGPLAQLEHGLVEGLAVHSPPLPGFSVGTWSLGVAVNFRYRPLAYAVGDAIAAAVSDGRIEAIHADHGLTWQAPEW